MPVDVAELQSLKHLAVPVGQSPSVAIRSLDRPTETRLAPNP